MTPSKHQKNVFWLSLLLFLLWSTPCKQGVYVAVAGDIIQLSVDSLIILAGESVTIKIRGIKANGRALPDDTLIHLSADSGSFMDALGKTVEAVLLYSGNAQVTYRSDANFSGPVVTIKAQSGAAVIQPEQLVITIQNVDIDKLQIVADKLTLPPADPPGNIATITVTAYNSAMAVVPGRLIFFETTAGTLLEPSPLTTNANGQVVQRLQTTVPADVTASYKTIVKAIHIDVSVNIPPVADFEFSPKNPIGGQTVYFTSTSTDADGTIDEYNWNFGDGSPDVGGATTSHVYPVLSEAKEYAVVLTIEDNDGKEAIKAKAVPVGISTNKPPVAEFTFSPQAPYVNNAIQFNAAKSHDEDGDSLTYKWNFGDSNKDDPDTHVTVSHTYQKAGTFVVTLTVDDGHGLQGVAIAEVKVSMPLTAYFTYKPDFPNTAVEITFDASLSQGDIILYEWDFGDGGTKKLTDATTTHIYKAPGGYKVILIVTGSNSEKASYVATISVR